MPERSNAEKILDALEEELDSEVELTLYGRAALQLGFENPPQEFALSRDVDAVFWLGQADELAEKTNFWQAVEAVNEALAGDELYISHFFEEDQVILQADWRDHRVPVAGPWTRLKLFRLGNGDLFLSKLMRDDPLDLADARFIVKRAGFTKPEISGLIQSARVPDITEIREQFQICSQRFL